MLNQDDLHVHGDLKMGDKSAFVAQEVKDLMMEQLRL
jgi:hypothetical protein